jgi:hypothetical protein
LEAQTETKTPKHRRHQQQCEFAAGGRVIAFRAAVTTSPDNKHEQVVGYKQTSEHPEKVTDNIQQLEIAELSDWITSLWVTNIPQYVSCHVITEDESSR